jgi:hypothetical protein
MTKVNGSGKCFLVAMIIINWMRKRLWGKRDWSNGGY